MDPFAFIEDEVIEPRGVRDLPPPPKPAAAAAVPPASASASSPPVRQQAVAWIPTPLERLARSEQFFKEVAKADGSEVPQFLSDVMAWASSPSVGVDVDGGSLRTDERQEETANGADAQPATEPPAAVAVPAAAQPAEPQRRTYAEEKAAARAAAAKVEAQARAAELKAAAAAEAVVAAKAEAAAKLARLAQKNGPVEAEPPRGTIQIKDTVVVQLQLARRGTVVGATSTPAMDLKRKQTHAAKRDAASGSAVKNPAAATKRKKLRPATPSPPLSAVKKVPQKQKAAAAPAPPAARKSSKQSRSRHLTASSPSPAEPEVQSRPTRRGRNVIAPLPWWTAAGNAAASKRSLTASSLTAAVTAAAGVI